MSRQVSDTADGVILGLCLVIGGVAIVETWGWPSLELLAWLFMLLCAIAFGVALVEAVLGGK